MVVYLPFVVGVCVVYIDVWVVLFDLVRLLYIGTNIISIRIMYKYISTNIPCFCALVPIYSLIKIDIIFILVLI